MMGGLTIQQQPAKWHPVLPFFCCLVSVLLTFLAVNCIQFFWTGSFGSMDAAKWFAILFAVIAATGSLSAVVFLQRYNVSLLRIIQLLIIAGFIGTALNIIFQFTKLLAYGDTGVLSEQFLQKNIIFPRWFLGSAFLNLLYQSLWPTIGRFLPEMLSTADGFVRVTGAALMACSSIALLRSFGPRLMILATIFSPLWLMFCTGYDEYYPFIAGLYLAVLCILLKGIGRYSPWIVAGIVSVLLLSYAGFVPLAGLVLVCYGWTAKGSAFLKAVAATGLMCIFAVIVLWPDTPTNFVHVYQDTLNLGEQNIGVQYAGLSANACSPFFKASYALSSEHMRQLLFMLFWGGAFLPILGMLPAGIFCFKRRIGVKTLRDQGVICIGLYFAFQVFYFIFMIPKLGAVRDIDMFFPFHLLLFFIAGLMGDRVLDTLSAYWSRMIQACVMGVLLGNSSVMLVYLLHIGIT
jgi:hypothetical protein